MSARRVENETSNNLYANVENSASVESLKPTEVRLLWSCQCKIKKVVQHIIN